MKYGVLKRNTKMAKRIISELEKKHNESMFIAPVIYHLLGNGSIPEIIKENGYEVRRVRSRDVINPEGSEDKKDKHKTQEDEPNKQKPPKMIRLNSLNKKVQTIHSQTYYLPVWILIKESFYV